MIKEAFLTQSCLDSSLPRPIRPSAPDSPTEESYGRGSLSDYSDYDSSDEEQHRQNASSSMATGPNHYADEQEDDMRLDHARGLLDGDDPFADPFADQEGVATPGINERKEMSWGH